MSEHLALRSSVGSRSSALPSHHHLPPAPDPLASVWIRRLHLTPNPPPPPRPPPLSLRAPPPPHQDNAVSTDESRTPPPPPAAPPRCVGFGPFRWSPRPLRGAPVAAWAAAGASGGGGGAPMLSPFFRLPAPPLPPVSDLGEVAPVRPLVGLGSRSGSGSGSGGYSGLSARVFGGGDSHAAWLTARAAGST
ncbi:uncharacterized protein LOC133913055 isoform X2 [Phragmites australis]|uniref:uncharacterized protein LOC133913055 isoform X2 n=1 Tax=Phragmites australis TaxID=29695 RepID=UPI002D79D9C4|nr:uncharacterized protein LOC133913055 isoform X2 [Phragmites australis]